IARARATALTRGGAVLVVDVAAGRFWIETPGGERVGDPVDLWRDYGVRLAVDGGGEARLSLRFDGLGLGRMANRTLRVVRGGAGSRGWGWWGRWWCWGGVWWGWSGARCWPHGRGERRGRWRGRSSGRARCWTRWSSFRRWGRGSGRSGATGRRGSRGRSGAAR